MKTRKSAGKPNAEWLVREGTVKSNSEKSSGSLNCFSFLTGLGIKAKSTKCKSAILICLTAFSSDYPPISDLIHLARCVKFNPQFNPWIVLIGLRGTEFNRRINLLRGFGRFNLGLALIGFRTTGARVSELILILVPRGRAPFGQHQESRPMHVPSPRFTDFPSLCACSESSLTNLIGCGLNVSIYFVYKAIQKRNVVGQGQRSRFLVLTTICITTHALSGVG